MSMCADLGQIAFGYGCLRGNVYINIRLQKTMSGVHVFLRVGVRDNMLLLFVFGP